jgi:hypothetical protein
LFVLSGAGREAKGAELGYMAFDGTHILLQDARTLDPISFEDYKVPAMENRLATLGGRGALNCGYAIREFQASADSDCALEAFASKRAFYVSYEYGAWVPGHSFGFAGDSAGNLYFVEYADVSSHVQLPTEDFALLGDNHIRFGACPKPPMLWKAGSGYLTCVAPRD